MAKNVKKTLMLILKLSRNLLHLLTQLKIGASISESPLLLDVLCQYERSKGRADCFEGK